MVAGVPGSDHSQGLLFLAAVFMDVADVKSRDLSLGSCNNSHSGTSTITIYMLQTIFESRSENNESQLGISRLGPSSI